MRDIVPQHLKHNVVRQSFIPKTITPSLVINGIDTCITENGKAHKTSKYELMHRKSGNAKLVVRRGQEFSLKLDSNRKYDPTTDEISLEFSSPGSGKIIKITLELKTNKDCRRCWEAVLDTAVDKSIKIKVLPSVEVPIGNWNVQIKVSKKNASPSRTVSVEAEFCLIFNPWCPDDDVYMESEAERQEYVMADTGLIWRGSVKQIQPAVWKYSQFEKDILDCAFHIIQDIAKISSEKMNDPVVLTRALTEGINANDGGILCGNWSGDYSDGTSPTKWLGSQKIIQEYYETKEPVRYGQCWVFAGVLATICRTLGIPCRVVTNYLSAHDTQGNLTIDYYFDADGKILEDINNDSIWNYHVWNEAWMVRPDLGSEYGGWQAIDATPQEESGETFRCGPASVAAVKQGDVDLPHDHRFVFSEVNADKVYWRYNGPSEPHKLIRKDSEHVGQMISTKAVGCWEREDITHLYKNEEDRASMINALKKCNSDLAEHYLNEEFDDVTFNLELRDDIVIGNPFSVVMKIKNTSDTNEYTVSVVLRAEVVRYSKRVGEPVKTLGIQKVIEPGAEEEVRMDVSWEEYGSRLMCQAAFNIVGLANVAGTDYEYFAQDDFRVIKPDIEITKKTEALVNEALEVEAVFTNPLPISLHNGEFLIHGPGFDREMKLPIEGEINPGQEVCCTFTTSPKVKGKGTIAVKFHSDELDDVDGFLPITVDPGTKKTSKVVSSFTNSYGEMISLTY